MHPWLVFLKESGKRLSDIEYLSIKEFDSKLTTKENSLSATGDLVTTTASSGKDMYIAKAKIIFRGENSSVAGISSVELKVNGVIKETASTFLFISAGEATDTNMVYEFVTTGLKVAATQIIKLEVITIEANTTIDGVLTTFEETTGESPAV